MVFKDWFRIGLHIFYPILMIRFGNHAFGWAKDYETDQVQFKMIRRR